MTHAQRITLGATLGVAAAVIGLDLFWATDDTEGNTISAVLQAQPWASGAAGFIVVHIFRPKDSKAVLKGWWGIAAGSIIAIGAAGAVGGGLIGVALGGATAWLTWENSGKS